MGEGEFKPNAVTVAVGEAVTDKVASGSEMRLVTPGGRYQVRWDEGGSAIAMGQLPFFAEFLQVSGLFERWVRDCPMAYSSPNAPATRDMLGTSLLSILDGQ